MVRFGGDSFFRDSDLKKCFSLSKELSNLPFFLSGLVGDSMDFSVGRQGWLVIGSTGNDLVRGLVECSSGGK